MAWKTKGHKANARPEYEHLINEILDDTIEPTSIEIVNEEELAEQDAATLTSSEAQDLRDILAELSRRENETLRLYEPMPEQELFHASLSPERLLLGGNRGGKTLAAIVELARAVTSQDPYEKYSKRDGVSIVVGRDLRHGGKVFYPKLFKPGAIKVIYDPYLCRVRAFRPHLEWDQVNYDEAKPAPPLIPRRFYSEKSISWENKREDQIKSIKFNTGWVTSFFSGEASPPNGWDADVAMFDEEIEHPEWYKEVAARLLDRRMKAKDKRRFINGRFWWSATPQAGTQHLYDLYERTEAERLSDSQEKSIERFEFGMLDNTHISEDAKRDFIVKMANDEDSYLVRVKGQFAIVGTRIYSEFMPLGLHGAPTFPIPDNWTRYMALDPGRQVCATLFVAIPPPGAPAIVLPNGDVIHVASRKIIYDEMYIKKCSAAIYAEALKKKLGEQRIQAWWIDMHAGRTTEIGSGYTVEHQYARELKRLKIACETTGSRFSWASADVESGILAVRSGLHLRECGYSEWLVMHEKLPNFLEEAKRYSYKKSPGTRVVTDQPLQKDNHLMDCWRYLALAPLKYQLPTPRPRAKGYTIAAIEAKRKRRSRELGSPHIKCY
jgi:K+/H+ antiporter YhaU regulatory subunit KhtT